MRDLIQIEIGARPWLPSDDAEPVAEFDRYDFPTCGLVRQGGQVFVFDCFEGHVMDGNVWVYARVSSAEAAVLSRSEGPAFDRMLERVFQGRPVMGVLAIDGRVRSGTAIRQEAIAEHGLGRALLRELQKGRDVATNAAEALKDLVGV